MAAAYGLTLLTGATGFVGRQVLRALGERGCRVRAVVRDSKQGHLAHDPAIETIVTSPDMFAESASWWTDACHGVDTVIHAAWYAEPGKYLQSPKNQDCLSGTLRLAEGAVQAKVRRFAGIGTCFEYDLDAGRLSIATALKPITPYAQAKVDAFNALSVLLPKQGIAFAWCRLFYLYGEGEDPRRFVPYLRARLEAGEPAELSTGSQIRDFLDVREAGRMIAEVALGPQEGPINICSGKPITVRELAENIADEFGRRDLLRFGARADNPVDPPCVVGIRG
ncbi:MAG TPA: NAD(P)-dependent oxidoreductase [Pseudolabrys sp.]|jgi:dTDP-6-deoxy-L-talose 4-dehydrogenase (NAD+)